MSNYDKSNNVNFFTKTWNSVSGKNKRAKKQFEAEQAKQRQDFKVAVEQDSKSYTYQNPLDKVSILDIEEIKQSRKSDIAIKEQRTKKKR